MLAKRINKETTDHSRVEIDLGTWLDPGEVITEILSSSITLGAGGWSEPPWPPPGAPSPYDPTPCIFTTVVMDASSRVLIVFLAYGTPGNAYTAQFVLQGSSARRITLELGVQCTGIPPVNPLPVPVPANQAALSLSIYGGIMLGPIYLVGFPQYPSEAATKEYVDIQLTDPSGLAQERYERIAADTLEANTRAAADLILSQREYDFRYYGRPGITQVVSWPVMLPCIIPYFMTGTAVHSETPPAGNPSFTVLQRRGLSNNNLGAVQLIAGSETQCIAQGTGGTLAVGDVIQVIAPAQQDAALSNLTIVIPVWMTIPGQ